MVVVDQDRPLRQGHATSAALAQLAVSVHFHLRARATVRVRAGVHRIVEQAQHARVGGHGPLHLLWLAWRGQVRQLHVVLAQPGIHFPGTAVLAKLVEEQVQGLAHTSIGMRLQAALLGGHVADREARVERSPLCFLEEAGLRALAKEREFIDREGSLDAKSTRSSRCAGS